MKLLLIPIAAFITATTAAFLPSSDRTTIATVATCYGYSPCNACTSCNYCNWCNAGGTCGVCATAKQSPKKYKAPAPSSGQCRATTKKGTRCSRSQRSGGYCWQHGG